MTSKLAATVAAGALALGILVGAAGTALVHDAARPTTGMGDMGDMGDMGQMMEMMDDGRMMDGGMMPGASSARPRTRAITEPTSERPR